jgi:hypothetical protein
VDKTPVLWTSCPLTCLVDKYSDSVVSLGTGTPSAENAAGPACARLPTGSSNRWIRLVNCIHRQRVVLQRGFRAWSCQRRRKVDKPFAPQPRPAKLAGSTSIHLCAPSRRSLREQNVRTCIPWRAPAVLSRFSVAEISAKRECAARRHGLRGCSTLSCRSNRRSERSLNDCRPMGSK